MIKLVMFAKRKAELTREEFNHYWLHTHAALIARHAREYGIVRYVQSHRTADDLNANLRASRGFVGDFDGVGELWWPSREAFLTSVNSPAGRRLRAQFIEDESRFVDLPRSFAIFTEEHEIVAAAAGDTREVGGPDLPTTQHQ